MKPLLLLPALLAIVLMVMAFREFALASRGSDSATEPHVSSGSVQGGATGTGTGVPPAAIALGLPDRIRRAGKSRQLNPRSLLFLKAAASAGLLGFAAMTSPLMPGRIAAIAMPVAALAGFFLPDFMLERTARSRHRMMIASLPDALDLLAVSVATGKSLGAGLLDLLEAGRGPLSRELAETGEDMAWRTGQAAALVGLRRRVGGKEMAARCATLERSRRLGSPLAYQLMAQST